MASSNDKHNNQPDLAEEDDDETDDVWYAIPSTKHDQEYYHNPVTNETTWVLPSSKANKSEDSSDSIHSSGGEEEEEENEVESSDPTEGTDASTVDKTSSKKKSKRPGVVVCMMLVILVFGLLGSLYKHHESNSSIKESSDEVSAPPMEEPQPTPAGENDVSLENIASSTFQQQEEEQTKHNLLLETDDNKPVEEAQVLADASIVQTDDEQAASLDESLLPLKGDDEDIQLMSEKEVGPPARDDPDEPLATDPVKETEEDDDSAANDNDDVTHQDGLLEATRAEEASEPDTLQQQVEEPSELVVIVDSNSEGAEEEISDTEEVDDDDKVGADETAEPGRDNVIGGIGFKKEEEQKADLALSNEVDVDPEIGNGSEGIDDSHIIDTDDSTEDSIEAEPNEQAAMQFTNHNRADHDADETVDDDDGPVAAAPQVASNEEEEEPVPLKRMEDGSNGELGEAHTDPVIQSTTNDATMAHEELEAEDDAPHDSTINDAEETWSDTDMESTEDCDLIEGESVADTIKDESLNENEDVAESSEAHAVPSATEDEAMAYEDVSQASGDLATSDPSEEEELGVEDGLGEPFEEQTAASAHGAGEVDLSTEEVVSDSRPPDSLEDEAHSAEDIDISRPTPPVELDWDGIRKAAKLAAKPVYDANTVLMSQPVGVGETMLEKLESQLEEVGYRVKIGADSISLIDKDLKAKRARKRDNRMLHRVCRLPLGRKIFKNCPKAKSRAL